MKKYDIKKLDTVLEKNNISHAWKKILKKHIELQDKKYYYILENNDFKNVKTNDLTEDLLKDLTIANIGVLYEYSLSYYDTKSRKDNGQFFTPDDIAETMAKMYKKIDKNDNGIWLDPCSGVGNLSYHLVKNQKNQEDFLKNRMRLSDKDPLALLVAHVILTISFQKNDNNLYNSIGKNFVIFDYLQEKFDTKKEIEDTGLKYDYVIANPPYVSKVSNKKFETDKCGDLYSYFMENIINASEGFIIITPQSFTHAKKFELLRNLMVRKCENTKIYSFDNMPDFIFTGIKFGSTNTNKINSMRPSITVSETTQNIQKTSKIEMTGLLRWKRTERSKALSQLDNNLSAIEVEENQIFPKVSKTEEKIYDTVKNNDKLETILSKKETEYCLYIPSTPRYYISASKKPLKRSSLKKLYFKTEQEMNKAYILINSSYMYWWWRINDGGMTLSLETIRTLPLIDFEYPDNLIKEIEKSDTEDMVAHSNAGKIQENIKRSYNLLYEINNTIMPEYSNTLEKTHNNSIFTEGLEY